MSNKFFKIKSHFLLHETLKPANQPAFLLTTMDTVFLALSYFLPLLPLIYLLLKTLDRKRRENCYILDYECYMPAESRKLSTKLSGDIVRRNERLGIHEYRFLLRAIVSSGIGEETYAPKMVFDGREGDATLEDGRVEMEEFFGDSIDKLFKRTGISPSDIDVLIVNVSMLATAPSLAAKIVSGYKLREDVKAYNLTGMGCSASLISVNIAQNIFKTRKNVNALVVTSESLSLSWYPGSDRSMILANCLFRTGGCAMILTNKTSLKDRAMFKLKCLVRTHHGARDESYECCVQKEDANGHVGFHLCKNLPKAATRAFVDNLKEIAPKIISVRELLRYRILQLVRKLVQKFKKHGSVPKATINFKRGVDHFCLHTGGKAVIDAIRQSLNLSEYDVEPARMTLHRFGNTSASSLWYVLAYMQSKKRLKKGDRIMMISFGAGFKCNSCLWEVNRNLDLDRTVWEDFIDSYPRKNLTNPFTERFGWLQDVDSESFIAPDDLGNKPE